MPNACAALRRFRFPIRQRGSADPARDAGRVRGLGFGALVAVSIGLLGFGRAAPAATTAAPAALPAGAWTTFANGDDILDLAWDDGVLWAGTRSGGLVRWQDGAAERYLRPQTPIGGNTVHDIEIDGAGRLWLATDGGLSVLAHGETASKSDDVWHTYTVDNSFAGLPTDDLRAIAVDGDTVWVGGVQLQDPITEEWSGGGLARLDTKGTPSVVDDVWAPVHSFESTYFSSPTGDDRVGLVSDSINDIAINSDGDVWVATSPHWRLERQQVGEETREVWTRGHGGIAFVDTMGTFDTTDDVWTPADCEDMEESVTCTVQAIEIDVEGIAWSAIGGRGVMYHRSTDRVIPDERSRRYQTSAGGTSDFVESIAFGPAEDPALKNLLFLATRDGGLSVIDHRGTLRNLDDDIWDFDRGEPFTTSDGLARNRIQAVVLGGGKIWVGTGAHRGTGGGIHAIDLVDLTVAPAMKAPGGPPTNFIADIDFGQEGDVWEDHVWIATGSRTQQLIGVGAVDLDTRGTYESGDDVWTHHSTLSTDSDGAAPWTGLLGDNVHAVAVQGERVWFGSIESQWSRPDPDEPGAYLDGGLSVFSGGNWTARNVANTGGPEAGLRSASVGALEVGCSGELWVGTGSLSSSGAGIDVLTPGSSVHVRTGDAWVAHSYGGKESKDTIPSRHISGISADCAGRSVWVSGEHHIRQPAGGTSGGIQEGGGAARFDLDAATWSRYDTRDGIESYARGEVLAEAVSVLAGPGSLGLIGTYGTRAMSTADLINTKPWWTAALNTFEDGAWRSETFEHVGRISSIARDADGRIWVGTSRGGAAREALDPDSWRFDRRIGGLYVQDDGAWAHLDVASAGLPSNDISVVRVAPNGDIWIGSEGGGLARFRPGAEPPTPTATGVGTRPTATSTRMPTVVRTSTPFESTPTAVTPGVPTRVPGENEIYLAAVVRNSMLTTVVDRIYVPFVVRRH